MIIAFFIYLLTANKFELSVRLINKQTFEIRIANALFFTIIKR